MTEPLDSAILEGLLDARRRAAFVGRVSEIELFDAALAADLSPFSVLHIHGPGGIGKSSLLDEFRHRAAAAEATTVRIDGRLVPPIPDTVRNALQAALVPLDGDVLTARRSDRVVLLVDAYERMAPLDDWLRTDLLPRLPATSLTVLAGRHPPSPDWRGDPAWLDRLRVVSLRNLAPGEADRFLELNRIPEAMRGRLIELTHGHPLALTLLTDVVRRGGSADLDPLDPDLVAILLRRFVDAIPSERHRRALEVCALSRTTTEALLRDALGLDDAHELFLWLRSLSFVEAGPDGLVPHDLARDVLDVDLRWRDPDAYRRVFRRCRAHIHRRLEDLDGTEQQRAIFDEKFVFRNLPSVLSPVDWAAWGDQYPEPARPEHRTAIVDMVRGQEGPESAAIAARWWDLDPSAFFVVPEVGGGVAGFLALVTLSDHAEDLTFDPGALAAWRWATARAPARPGEAVTQTRFIVDRHCHQAPSPTLNAAPVLTMQRYLRNPALAWDFLTLADPDPLDDYFAIADLPRAVGGDFVVDGRTYGLFAHDFRRVPVDAWLEVVTERALAQDPSVAPAPTADVVVLSQPAFSDAVRQALRDLGRPGLLSRNPLQRARFVAEDPDGRSFEAILRSATDGLGSHPRDEKRWRALDRTYLRPAPTQERAAELLGLPFSTYRRHLTEGVDRIVARLWDLEVQGPHAAGRDRPGSTVATT